MPVSGPTTRAPVQRFERAERGLLDHYEVVATSRYVDLADPPLRVRVLEAGDPAAAPVLFVHGSGMSAPTWAPVLTHLAHRRIVAVDLPGFGLSDPHDYSRRSLRRHAVAQLTSILDATELRRVPIAGTSLGGMWALCLALEHPERVSAVISLGMPAAALPGLKSDPFFKAMTTPVLRSLVSRLPAPGTPRSARRAMKGVIGPAVERTPDAFFDVVAAGMRMPGWTLAMRSHLPLAFDRGRARPENFLTDEELRRIEVPVLLVWGTDDVYGGPDIGRRAVAVLPDARLEVLPGNHAPFLDDPARCAALIDAMG